MGNVSNRIHVRWLAIEIVPSMMRSSRSNYYAMIAYNLYVLTHCLVVSMMVESIVVADIDGVDHDSPHRSFIMSNP